MATGIHNEIKCAIFASHVGFMPIAAAQIGATAWALVAEQNFDLVLREALGGGS